ncbi:protein of unknown function [Kyrpidia spormannii]|uniref:Uncharacterized protein n=1 Tax=Kyrpidia spormannii TaxID=2055160 RepID=A0A6F9E5M6_9BACL|nr:protein of unknown function [Kyrpidia spormannii]
MHRICFETFPLITCAAGNNMRSGWNAHGEWNGRGDEFQLVTPIRLRRHLSAVSGQRVLQKVDNTPFPLSTGHIFPAPVQRLLRDMIHLPLVGRLPK